MNCNGCELQIVCDVLTMKYQQEAEDASQGPQAEIAVYDEAIARATANLEAAQVSDPNNPIQELLVNAYESQVKNRRVLRNVSKFQLGHSDEQIRLDRHARATKREREQCHGRRIMKAYFGLQQWVQCGSGDRVNRLQRLGMIVPR
jgi:hypothetical protein